VTSSPSETETTQDTAPEAAEPHPLQEYADTLAAAVGGDSAVVFDTIKVEVDRAAWVDALTTARDELGLIFFSWLSAVDWSSEVEVGDPYPEG
jgi:NADH-quinone oxidoreductase subunit C